MTLDQIVRIQGIIDKRAVRSDTLEFLNKTRYSHSKQANIRFGDMHIDHFLRVVATMEDEDTLASLIEKIATRHAKTN